MLTEFLNRFKKRQAVTGKIESAWPFGNITPIGGNPGNIPTVRRCISTYASFLSILDLECEDEKKTHYFIDLINNGGNPAFTKSEFMQMLCWQVFIYGNFICRAVYDKAGKITRLDPYLNNGARAYLSKGGDYGDPESIQRGYYYRSNYSSRVFWPDEVLHIRDRLGDNSDLLNAVPRSYYYKDSFDTANTLTNVELGYAYSSGRGAVMLEGLDAVSDSEADQEVRLNVKTLIQSGLKSSSNQVMTLPQGYKVQRLLDGQSHSLLEWLSERSDLEIAKIFDTPYEILQTGKIGAQSLKEVWRAYIRFTLRSFCVRVAESFSKCVNDGTKFCFRIGKLRFSDARESATYFSSLIQDGVLSPQEVKEELEQP